jgi:hypothetical protein
MAWNRIGGLPTPPAPGEDHRTCPVCGGLLECFLNCRLGLSAWDVDTGRVGLEAMDEIAEGDVYGATEGGFLPSSDGFTPLEDPEDFTDAGDFE